MNAIDRRGFLAGSLVAAGAALGVAPAAAQTQLPAAGAKKVPGIVQPSPADRAAMDTTARAFAQQFGVPGLSIAVMQNGVPVYVQTFGVAENLGGVPLQPSHVFRIAGCSKPITAAAIFTLIEQRRFGLGDRVFGPGSILDTSFGWPPAGPWAEQVTVEHLLTHTAGGWEAGPTDPMFTNTRMNHGELVTWTLHNVPLHNPPGSTFAVSNFGYCVLGRVIEHVSGTPYPAYVQQAVLSRCGISTMRIGGATFGDRYPDEVVYYGQPGEKPYEMNLTRMDADNGWIATPSDLATFAAHLNKVVSRLNILKPQTVVIMTSGSAANPAYAKGWEVGNGNWWHHGSLPGSTSIVAHSRSGFTWAALANTHQPNGNMDATIDQMMWTLVRQVRAWKV